MQGEMQGEMRDGKVGHLQCLELLLRSGGRVVGQVGGGLPRVETLGTSLIGKSGAVENPRDEEPPRERGDADEVREHEEEVDDGWEAEERLGGGETQQRGRLGARGEPEARGKGVGVGSVGVVSVGVGEAGDAGGAVLWLRRWKLGRAWYAAVGSSPVEHALDLLGWGGGLRRVSVDGGHSRHIERRGRQVGAQHAASAAANGTLVLQRHVDKAHGRLGGRAHAEPGDPVNGRGELRMDGFRRVVGRGWEDNAPALRAERAGCGVKGEAWSLVVGPLGVAVGVAARDAKGRAEGPCGSQSRRSALAPCVTCYRLQHCGVPAAAAAFPAG